LKTGECINGSSVRRHGVVYVFSGSPFGVASPAMYSGGTGNTDINTSGVLIDYVYGTEDNQGTVNETAAKVSCTSLSPADGCIPAVAILRNPVIYNIKNGYDERVLGHEFGTALTVMKINNSDTADTLLVSAPKYEHPDCYNYADPQASASELNQGRIYVFRGGKFGLTGGAKTDYYPAPLVNNASRCQNMPDVQNKGLGLDAFNRLRAIQMKIVSPAGASNNRNRGWAMRMTSADINGDGFEDLFVSAPNENVPDQNGTAVTGAGTGYVMYGPLCSTDNDPLTQNYVQDPTRLNKQERYDDIKNADGSVKKAGVVTSTGVTYAGPCSGKLLAPQKFRAKDISVSSSTNARYGYSIAASRVKRGDYRGDINLDKFSDVVFGSPEWDDSVNSATDVGRGIVLFGSPEGLYTDDYPSSVVEPLSNNRTKPYILLPPTSVSGARFYDGNISTGDMNGDQSMDLMVPSFSYDSTNSLVGIDLGTFFLFY
jgi:large repetitive protein